MVMVINQQVWVHSKCIAHLTYMTQLYSKYKEEEKIMCWCFERISARPRISRDHNYVITIGVTIPGGGGVYKLSHCELIF